MATRFYLPSTGTPSISPSFDNDWDATAEADRIEMVTTKISSSFATHGASETSASSSYYVLLRQYVSATPFCYHAFTGSDTATLYIRCMESNTKMDAKLSCLLKIVETDGSLVDYLTGAAPLTGFTEFDTGLENRTVISTLDFAIMHDNEYLVLEIGCEVDNTKTDSYTATMDFGDNSGTDLPENETETSQYNPWLELSVDLTPYTLSTYKQKVIIF